MMDPARARSIGDAAFAVDASAILIVSAGICHFGQRLSVMSVLVPVVLLARLVLWLLLPERERDSSRVGELAFYSLCTLLGAYNDWSSVTRHRVYDYTVPTDLPGISHIPLWMLLYWGMILRFMLSVAHYRRLKLPLAPDGLFLGARRSRSVWLGIGFQLLLVLGTRQAIYRAHDHPVWSWLPFAAALVLALALLRPHPRRLVLVGCVMVLGPVVEAAYIQLGGLHLYRLGWFAGVPLWIALWWGLAVLIWQDLGTRLQAFVDFGARRPASAA